MCEKQKKQLNLFQSKEELLSGAEKQALLAADEFKVSVKLYYIARYFVAIYESRYQEIPIQIWNEYRNALDHFFRHLTSGGKIGSPDDVSGNLKKMEGHLQRAALDILKIFSHKSHDSVKALKEEHDIKILKLVDNGVFIKSINEEFHRAENLFELAKVNDLELGNDTSKNAEVLEIYLDAAFAYDQLKYLIIEKAPEIHHASEQYDQIHSRAHNHSIFQGLTIHITAAVIIGIGGILIGRYWPVIKDKGLELIHNSTVADEKIIDEFPVKRDKNAK